MAEMDICTCIAPQDYDAVLLSSTSSFSANDFRLFANEVQGAAHQGFGSEDSKHELVSGDWHRNESATNFTIVHDNIIYRL